MQNGGGIFDVTKQTDTRNTLNTVFRILANGLATELHRTRLCGDRHNG